MATRAQVQALLSSGHTFPDAAEALGISPGAAYLIATGRPADGSDSRWFSGDGAPTPEDSGPVPDHAEGRVSAEPSAGAPPGGTPRPASPQQLLGVPAHNPTHNEHVDAWIRDRAARELTPRP